MGILAKLLASLPLIPAIVNGIEQIHGGIKDGATKKQIAMQTLGLATAVAGAVIPGEAVEVTAASDLASVVIDGVVAAFNKTGWGATHVPTLPVPFAGTRSSALTGKRRKVS